MPDIRYFLNLYAAFLKVSLLGQIQYRASGAIWMIGSVLEPTIFLIVWSRVAESQGGQVGNYGPREFAAYYIVLLLINHLTFSWIMQVFQFRIQFGGLSYELLRPVHPIHADISDNIAYKIVQMTIMLPALIILILIFEPAFNFEAWSLLLALPVLVFAFFIRFFLEWTLALVAFWTTRTMAINQMYFAVMMFFSGRVAPIALMPLWIQGISENLPFYYILAFPVELLIGRVSFDEALANIVVQLIWLGVSVVLMLVVWRKAVRNYSAVGG